MDRNNLKDRETLKKYFKKGAVPTEQQFAGLIDSVSNLVDDGQIMRTATGWGFYPKQDGRLDIALYKEEPADETASPLWTIAVTPDKKLVISNENGEAVIEAEQDKSLTLRGRLTVTDEITASGFRTTEGGGDHDGYLTIPADKQWHNLLPEETKEKYGSRVYQIYASFLEQGTGLSRLTRATAIRQNILEQKIESPQKHWWGWSGGLCLRWQEINGKPCLQMRCKKRLPSGVVHCRIIEVYKGQVQKL